MGKYDSSYNARVKALMKDGYSVVCCYERVKYI